MKIITILGARPQFIKASVLSKRMKLDSAIEEIVVHTGQHYDSQMSDVFFDELEIDKPKYALGIGSSSHGTQTGRMLEQIETIVIQEKPDAILVYGDTNSTLAGALVGSKLHIPVVHVEAGLRSFNKKMPEEINRVLTDHVSALLFAPTQLAVHNLGLEGISGSHVVLCGDIMYDVALHFLNVAKARSTIQTQLLLEKANYLLLTIHRAENTDNEFFMKQLFAELRSIAEETRIIFPVHPRTEKMIKLFGIDLGKIEIIPPVGYLDMVILESNAKKIITDSGGVQKEGYFYGVPCLVVRNETEWMELIDIGFNQLIKTNQLSYIRKYAELKTNLDFPQNIYGQGDTAELIFQRLLDL